MDNKPFRILALAGSLRQGSFNRGLLRAAKELAPEWIEIEFFDIGTLPFFNEDLEAAGETEEVRRFKDAIRSANAVLIATPEYNGAVPGVLANAIDWASRPTGQSVLRNKPVAVMGAVLGKSGSVNAQAVLRGVLSRIGAVVVPDPQVLVAGRLQTLRRAGQFAARGHPRGNSPVGRGVGPLVSTGSARRAGQRGAGNQLVALKREERDEQHERSNAI